MVRVLAVDPERPSAAAIEEAARVLRAGGLVAFPTETVYGIGGRALDAAALARIFAAKGRPSGHPLIAHVVGEAGARSVAAEWPEAASRLARAFWPGPLTLVVPRAPHVPAAIAGGLDSIAVRAPAHGVAQALLAAVGEPLAAPSANPYQTLSPTTAHHVVKALGDRVDLVLDGGACREGIESTVLDVRTARVLRPGALDLARLREVVPDVAWEREALASSAARASPGMDARHYAPRARLVVLPREAIARAGRQGEIGVVLRGADLSGLEGARRRVLPADPVHYAHDLFAALHALDEAGCDVILVEAVPEDDERWWAVADRLRRASA
jgi:L-threonylcarbamoyladenylate synthase